MAFNGRWRWLTDSVQFDWRYVENDMYLTYFGGIPFYNSTTYREEIQYGFCGYMLEINLYTGQLSNSAIDALIDCKFINIDFKDDCSYGSYSSCFLCRPADGHYCLVYDTLTSTTGLLVASYSLDTFSDIYSQIIKDLGPFGTYSFQRGSTTSSDS